MSNPHGPIELRHHALMNALGAAIDDSLNGIGSNGPKEFGFVLLVFGFGDPKGHRMNYLSNAERADMICALKELVANFEGRVQDSPSVPQ